MSITVNIKLKEERTVLSLLTDKFMKNIDSARTIC